VSPQQGDDVTPHSTPHAHPIEQSLDHRPLVLVVHRSPSVRQALLVTLDLDGFEVLVAADGTEATALLLEMRPHMVIADLGVADDHVAEFVGRLRADTATAHIPVIDFGQTLRRQSPADRADDTTDRTPRADSLGSLLDLLRRVADTPSRTPGDARPVAR
jgi:CheY-like chemotaxis protein